MEINPREFLVKAPKIGAHICVAVLWGKEEETRATFHNITFSHVNTNVEVEKWKVIYHEIQFINIEEE